MARLSAWILLPLLCGSSLAKEGSVVSEFLDSSSIRSFSTLSPLDTRLNPHVPYSKLVVRDNKENLEISDNSSFLPATTGFAFQTRGCRPRKIDTITEVDLSVGHLSDASQPTSTSATSDQLLSLLVDPTETGSTATLDSTTSGGGSTTTGGDSVKTSDSSLSSVSASAFLTSTKSGFDLTKTSESLTSTDYQSTESYTESTTISVTTDEASTTTESSHTTDSASYDETSTTTAPTSQLSDTTTLGTSKSASDTFLSTSAFPTTSDLITSAPQSTFESVISTTNSPLVLTVAADGSGDYTAINDAIKTAQASGIPTVTILAGTYTENVVIQATQTVTIQGEVSEKRDYTSNKVVIENGGKADPALSFTVANAAGVTWRNIKFSNTLVGGSGGAVFLRGSRNAFYGCEFVTAGIAAITGSYASAMIANSYLEAQDKVIYNFPSLYIFKSTITATKSNAILVYNKGVISGSTLYNTTVVFDTCSVIQKSGTTNTKVYLAAGNGDGSVAVYRDTSLASFIATTGVYVDAKTQSTLNQYIEFGTTGDGSYTNHVSDRSKYISLFTDANNLAPYEISSFFRTVYPAVAATDLTWVDSGVLSAIRASNAKDFEKEEETVSTTTSEYSSTTASATSTSSVPSASGLSTITASSVASASSVSSTAVSDPCSLPSSIPSTALVVGPKSNTCASYESISSAVAALPNDATTQYIYVLAGTYQEKVTVTRAGATIVLGESSNAASYMNNRVTISANNAVLSSAGGSAGTATLSANKYEAKLVSFYNINFENSFEATTNNIALAVYAKGTKVAFYGCNVVSSQGTLYLDYGNFYFSHSRIEGTTDFVWGQGAGYIYNSIIVSAGTITGQTIAAHKFQSSYGGSQLVFDLCAVVPSDSSVPKGSTYLGRDYSTKSTVAFVNSYLDGHIASAGWKISSASTFTGTFAEGNNTGPGAASSSGRSSSATLLTDTTSYSASSILGDVSWLDKDAIAPFLGWPKSVYGSDSVSTTVTSSSVTSSTTSSTASSVISAGSTLTVAPSPTGNEFKTIASAIAAVPEDGQDYTIYIKAGSYNEQLTLTNTPSRIILRGETTFENDFTQNQVLVWFRLGYSTSASRNEETPVIFWKNTAGKGLSMYNLNFTNTYPQTSSTAALAADFFGPSIAAYGCAFKGFQDTLLVNQGVQVFSNSYIEGSVDFIWGYSKAYFHQCYIASNTPNAYVTANARKSSSWDGGFVFDTCKVTYTSSYGSSFGTTSLGRPWSSDALVVYMNSYLDKHISSAGWAASSSSSPQTSVSSLYYGMNI